MELPPAARRHIATNQIAWLTTVTDDGSPAPTPVWFVADGDELVVFCEPIARKLGNIAARPNVTLHFDTDPGGQDVVVIRCVARVVEDASTHDQPGYLEKYPEAIEYVDTSTVKVVLTPVGVWLGPD